MHSRDTKVKDQSCNMMGVDRTTRLYCGKFATILGAKPLIFKPRLKQVGTQPRSKGLFSGLGAGRGKGPWNEVGFYTVYTKNFQVTPTLHKSHCVLK